MRKELLTAIHPPEIREILKNSGAWVNLRIWRAEPFHGMPR
ncbi:hypothetical protein [Thermococcus sp. P6]|nr:hypothetical protein [Thermococcus sp. P6]